MFFGFFSNLSFNSYPHMPTSPPSNSPALQLGFRENLNSNPHCWLRITDWQQTASSAVWLLTCCCSPGAELPPLTTSSWKMHCQTLISIYVRAVLHTMQICPSMAPLHSSIWPDHFRDINLCFLCFEWRDKKCPFKASGLLHHNKEVG